MGNLVVRATASQAVPPRNDPNFVAGNFGKGILAIQASGTGTGPWGGTFNVAYVSPAGVMGAIALVAWGWLMGVDCDDDR